MNYELIIKDYMINEIIGKSRFEAANIVLTEDTYILNENLINSIDFIKLITYIEDKFNIDLIDENFNINNFRTLKDLFTIVNNRLDSKESLT
jgi:acyl carrier protein